MQKWVIIFVGNHPFSFFKRCSALLIELEEIYCADYDNIMVNF